MASLSTRTAGNAPPAPAPYGDSVIEVRDLVHRYGERTALAGLTFDVRAGEIFGVLGPNGGGKSTLFRILATMVSPTAGTLRLDGRDPRSDLVAVRRRLGVVFQAPALDRMLTVEENLLHQGHLYGLRGKALRTRIDAMVELVGLGDRLRERAGALSGGMRRRVEIAKSLLHGPSLLLMDEPTTGLDPAARLDLWDHLRRLRRAEHVTIAFTTHLMDEADGCSRLLVLDEGHRVALDTPSALKSAIPGEIVTVEADDADAMAPAIAAALGVECTAVSGRLRIETREGGEIARAILQRFGDAVRAVTVGRATLEDVFLHLTGHRFEGEETPPR